MQATKTVFMFSGQGSQYYQMGQPLYQENPTFRDWMQRMDPTVRALSGHSVIDALYNQGHSKAEIFDHMLLTGPAIFMVEYALAQTLIDADILPDLTLGASMGSYAAAAVAGCITVEEALECLVTHANLCEKHCSKGGMIAILDEPSLYQADVLRNNSTIASYNFANHFVVAAQDSHIRSIEAFLREKNVIFQRLPVNFAFHSSGIDSAKEQFVKFLESIQRKPAVIPMACCAKADTLSTIPADYFWTVAREPIRFNQTVECLENIGTYRYIDVGPAGTLATFLKYALPPSSHSKAVNILTPFGRDVANLSALVPQ